VRRLLMVILCFTLAQQAASTQVMRRSDTYAVEADLLANKLHITSPQGSSLVEALPLAGLTFVVGQAILSEETSRALVASGGFVTRPPMSDQNAIVLREGDAGA